MRSIEDRWYQREAAEALMRDIDSHNPMVAIPTGGGKTIIMCLLIEKILHRDPLSHILVVSNTQEIVRQDHDAIAKFFPQLTIGLYSSGLNSKTTNQITVAGIQSIYNKGKLFLATDICIFDECHTIPNNKKSMYRTLIKGLNCKYVGMSATVFRCKSGYLHKGEDRLFDKLSYDLTSYENFNKLVSDGYLTQLVSKPTEYELDSTGVRMVAGDYNLKQLSEKHDRKEITTAAIKEVLQYGRKYKSWLVFAIDIAHADHIAD